MTQAAQPAYGGRPAYGAYNAPPPSQYAGYPPSSAAPQQDPNRFYGAGAPPSQGPAGHYPPAGSNPAFFMVPPGEQRPQQTPAPQAGPPSNAYSDPALSRVPVARPQSFAPQELSTGHYDSPIDNRHSFHGAPQGAPPAGQEYSAYPPQQQQSQPPGYPPQSSAPQGPPAQSNPYEHITSPPPAQHDPQPPADAYAPAPQQNQYGYPPQQQPSQPGYAPPAPPGTTSSPPPPGQGYLPYRPGGQAPSAPVGGGGDEGFYR